MIIEDDHAEFAVVSRLRELLNRDHSPYEVTATYAHFTAIICWVTQRIRSSGSSAADLAAARVWADLERELITQAPWNFRSAEQSSGVVAIAPSTSEAFRDHTAQRLVKNLRDATAHGDARKVRPYHQGKPGEATRTLVGFTFFCEERENRKVVWTGEITLRHSDMLRIANELAVRFCEAMKEHARSYLEQDARAGLVEAEAA